MKKIYGVKSIVPANKQLKNRRNLFSWFKHHKGAPAFWARSLTSGESITKSELAFLNKNKCKILFVQQDLTQRIVTGKSATKYVSQAISFARRLGVDDTKTAIFAQINPEWRVNPRWMVSYVDGMIANGFIPGFICSEDVYNAINNIHVTDEISRWVRPITDNSQVVFMLFAPKSKKDDIPHQSKVALHICGKVKFEGFETDIIEITDERILEYLWLPQIE